MGTCEFALLSICLRIFILLGFFISTAATAVSYVGEVKFARTEILSFEESGRMTEVVKAGTIIHSDEIINDFNSNLKSYKLAQQSTTRLRCKLIVSQKLLKIANNNMIEKANNYKRHQSLRDKNVISLQVFEKVEHEYVTAYLEFENAKIQLALTKTELEGCSLRAPFAGIVQNVYALPGAWVDKGEKILRLSMMTPIKIRVYLPCEVTSKLSLTSLVLVYPFGSNNALAGIIDMKEVRVNYAEFYVSNELVDIYPRERWEYGTVVRDLSFAIQRDDADADSQHLWIPSTVIRKDKGGYFVWKAVGQTFGNILRPIKKSFKAKKISIVPEKKFVDFFTHKYQRIKKGLLNKNDVIITNEIGIIKHGGLVYYQPQRWRYRPGEKVKVTVIP
jgi:hypothetical protein